MPGLSELPRQAVAEDVNQVFEALTESFRLVLAAT